MCARACVGCMCWVVLSYHIVVEFDQWLRFMGVYLWQIRNCVVLHIART